MTLFLDMDNVLCDFAGHHEAMLGRRPTTTADDVDWEAVRAVPGFYADMPPMADMGELWGAVRHLDPVLLTGVPKSVPAAADDKRTWVRKHLGTHVLVVTTLSKDKAFYAKPGDVLVDDWNKYKHLWVAAGGHWVTHTSAASTVDKLAQMGKL